MTVFQVRHRSARTASPKVPGNYSRVMGENKGVPAKGAPSGCILDGPYTIEAVLSKRFSSWPRRKAFRARVI